MTTPIPPYAAPDDLTVLLSLLLLAGLAAALLWGVGRLADSPLEELVTARQKTEAVDGAVPLGSAA